MVDRTSLAERDSRSSASFNSGVARVEEDPGSFCQIEAASKDAVLSQLH
jgi:hypothetical protein